MTPALLTVAQVAAQLGTSHRNVYQLLNNGTLPSAILTTSRGTKRAVDAGVLARYQAHRAQGLRKCAERCPDDLTIQEVAVLTGLAVRTVESRMQRGFLPRHAHGNRMVVRRSDAQRIRRGTRRLQEEVTP